MEQIPLENLGSVFVYLHRKRKAITEIADLFDVDQHEVSAAIEQFNQSGDFADRKAVLSTWYLRDVLCFMDRDALDTIQTSNRFFKNLIAQEFASKPLRVVSIYSVRIEYTDNENQIISFTNYTKYGYFDPYSKKWADFKAAFFSIPAVRPFLAKFLRFKNIEIRMPLHNFKPEHIEELETISHIWRGQELELPCRHTFTYTSKQNYLMHFLKYPAVFQCKTLKLGFYNNSMKTSLGELHTIPVIHLCCFVFKNLEEILELIRLKMDVPHNKTVWVISPYNDTLVKALKIIKEDFLKSSKKSSFRVIIEVEDPGRFPETSLVNNTTKEVLQVKHITGIDVRDNYDVKIKFGVILERIPI